MLKLIPVCLHTVHHHCCKSWFGSRNQEKEQRCPICNIQLDITEMRRLKNIYNSRPSMDSSMLREVSVNQVVPRII